MQVFERSRSPFCGPLLGARVPGTFLHASFRALALPVLRPASWCSGARDIPPCPFSSACAPPFAARFLVLGCQGHPSMPVFERLLALPVLWPASWCSLHEISRRHFLIARLPPCDRQIAR